MLEESEAGQCRAGDPKQPARQLKRSRAKTRVRRPHRLDVGREVFTQWWRAPVDVTWPKKSNGPCPPSVTVANSPGRVSPLSSTKYTPPSTPGASPSERPNQACDASRPFAKADRFCEAAAALRPKRGRSSRRVCLRARSDASALRFAQPHSRLRRSRALTGAASVGGRAFLPRHCIRKIRPGRVARARSILRDSRVLFGLAWESDDEGRAHRNARNARTKVVDEFQDSARRCSGRSIARRTSGCACCSGMSMYLQTLGRSRHRRRSVRESTVAGYRYSSRIHSMAVDFVQALEQLPRDRRAAARDRAPTSTCPARSKSVPSLPLGQRARFLEDRLFAAAAKLSAQLRNDAERARMIAAFGDLEIRRCARRRDQARQKVVLGLRLRSRDAPAGGPRARRQANRRCSRTRRCRRRRRSPESAPAVVRRSAGPDIPRRRAAGRAACAARARESISVDSALAGSMNAHVLMTTVSASFGVALQVANPPRRVWRS